jgi:hypothetical protein
MIAACCIVASIASCGGGQSPSGDSQARTAATVTAVSQQISVGTLTKLSETRVSRTVYAYVFRVSFVNSGGPQTGVTAKVTGAGKGTTIVDGDVVVGNMAAGATVTSQDTITLNHDRSYPFDAASLTWSITSTVTQPTVPGILVSGPANARAVDMLTDYIATRSDADLATRSDGKNVYYVNDIEAVLDDNATVSSVNAALNLVGARIVYSSVGDGAVTLQVPTPANLSALQALAKQLTDSGAFAAAGPAFIDAPKKLFDNAGSADALSPTGPYFQHVASRVVQGWNVLNAEKFKPVNVEIIQADFWDPDKDGDEHGLGVASQLDRRFSQLDPLGVVQLDKPLARHNIYLDGPYTINQKKVSFRVYLVEKLRAIFTSSPSKKYVLNLSIGYEDPSLVPLSAVEKDALWWRRKMRAIFPAGYHYENQVLQVSAAGNEEKYDAPTASQFNAAGKLNITGPAGKNNPPLTNTLVVENREADYVSNMPTRAACLSESSNIHGDVGAIGHEIYVVNTSTTAKFLTGTSFSTPQVSGLAAWMLAIRPSMAITDLRSRIIKTSVTDSCPDAAPMIDAFAALLSLDTSMSDAPVRLAMLQPTRAVPATTFGMADATAFLTAFFPAAYQSSPPPVVQPDFSRYDLNGDGFTGDSTKRAPFDLKFDGSPGPFVPTAITAYEYPVGTTISALDEKSVTDFEVLCYYVNSPLFNQADKQLFETELLRISAVPAIGRKISCQDRKVSLDVHATAPGWTGLPAHIVLSNLVPRFPATSAGNSPTCTNQGEPPGERGTPLFSSQVPSPTLIFAAIDVVGVPSQIGREPNRRNCSSFFASAGQQVWINATGRTVFGFGGSVVSDWEFQVRYSNGDARGVGKQCAIGVVPGSGFFLAGFSDPTCTHQEFTAISQ